MVLAHIEIRTLRTILFRANILCQLHFAFDFIKGPIEERIHAVKTHIGKLRWNGREHLLKLAAINAELLQALKSQILQAHDILLHFVLRKIRLHQAENVLGQRALLARSSQKPGLFQTVNKNVFRCHALFLGAIECRQVKRRCQRVVPLLLRTLSAIQIIQGAFRRTRTFSVQLVIPKHRKRLLSKTSGAYRRPKNLPLNYMPITLLRVAFQRRTR